jgi:UDP:flavonoid glycosyltransferase YjiC (YdhE family)
MRITILTVGSRGDVQPYVALGLGLKAAGHTVKVATASNFAAFVTGYGLEFAPLSGDMLQLMQSEAGLQAMERGNIIGFMRKAIDAIEPMVDKMAHDALEACRDADAIVAATSMVFPAEALSQYLGIPYIPSYPQPILPTRDYQSMAFPPAPSWFGPLKGRYNRLSHHIMLQVLWQLMRRPSNRVRRRMGLPSMPLFASLKDIWKGDVPVLYCFSPNVVPPASDHGENNEAHPQQAAGYRSLNTQFRSKLRGIRPTLD